MFTIETEFYEFLFKFAHYLFLNLRNSSSIYKIFATLFVGFDLILILLEFAYVIKAPDGFVAAIKALGTFSFHIVIASKILHYIFYRNIYIDIVNDINRNKFTFKHFDDFEVFLTNPVVNGDEPLRNYEELKDFWYAKSKRNRNVNVNEKLLEIENGIKRRSSDCAYFLIVVLLLSALMSLTFTYYKVVLLPPNVYYDDDLQMNVAVNELPYNMVHLLNIKDPFQYKISCYFQAIAFYHITVVFMSTILHSIFFSTN